MRFFETSAKDGTNVKEAFHALARDIAQKMMAAEGADTGDGTVKQLRDRKNKDCVIQ
jgi:GTPase SAR1 family protein